MYYQHRVPASSTTDVALKGLCYLAHPYTLTFTKISLHHDFFLLVIRHIQQGELEWLEQGKPE